MGNSSNISVEIVERADFGWLYSEGIRDIVTFPNHSKLVCTYSGDGVEGCDSDEFYIRVYDLKTKKCVGFHSLRIDEVDTYHSLRKWDESTAVLFVSSTVLRFYSVLKPYGMKKQIIMNHSPGSTLVQSCFTKLDKDNFLIFTHSGYSFICSYSKETCEQVIRFDMCQITTIPPFGSNCFPKIIKNGKEICIKSRKYQSCIYFCASFELNFGETEATVIVLFDLKQKIVLHCFREETVAALGFTTVLTPFNELLVTFGYKITTNKSQREEHAHVINFYDARHGCTTTSEFSTPLKSIEIGQSPAVRGPGFICSQRFDVLRCYNDRFLMVFTDRLHILELSFGGRNGKIEIAKKSSKKIFSHTEIQNLMYWEILSKEKKKLRMFLGFEEDLGNFDRGFSDDDMSFLEFQVRGMCGEKVMNVYDDEYELNVSVIQEREDEKERVMFLSEMEDEKVSFFKIGFLGRSVTICKVFMI